MNQMQYGNASQPPNGYNDGSGNGGGHGFPTPGLWEIVDENNKDPNF